MCKTIYWVVSLFLCVVALLAAQTLWAEYLEQNGAADTIDLTGIWSASWPTGPIRVRITQNGNQVVAVKLDGSVYVPAGAVAFSGSYNANPFLASQSCAAEGYRDPYQVPVRIDVRDRNFFVETLIAGSCEGFPITYRRITPAPSSNSAPDRATAGGWKLTSLTPESAIVDQPVLLRVKLDAIGGGGAEPGRIVAHSASGESIELQKQPDGTFSGNWKPSRDGTQTIKIEAVGAASVAPIEITINISRPASPTPGHVSRQSPPDSVNARDRDAAMPPVPPVAPPPRPLAFRNASGKPLDFGRLKSGSTAGGTLEIEGIPPDGRGELILDTDLPGRGINLEIQGPDGWTRVGSSPIAVKVTDSKWPLRVRVGGCPAACNAGDQYHLNASVRNVGGMSDVLHVSIHVEVQPDPWLACNWPYVAALSAAMVLVFIGYGFYSPFRFPRRAGVQLSPETDLGEGFFYSLRGQPGARSGFYRDARLFISDDYRISGKNGGAFAKLRAGRNNKVYIMPCNGRAVWRQRMDGEWERLSDTETVASVGTPFRNDHGSVFFDVRLR